MVDKKKELAARLSEKGITLIYDGGDSPYVFVVTNEMSAYDINQILEGEGFETSYTPESGIFATAEMKTIGYWCKLK